VASYAKGGHEEDLECSICLSEFKHGHRLRVITGCAHAFCQMCLDPWLLQRYDEAVKYLALAAETDDRQPSAGALRRKLTAPTCPKCRRAVKMNAHAERKIASLLAPTPTPTTPTGAASGSAPVAPPVAPRAEPREERAAPPTAPPTAPPAAPSAVVLRSEAATVRKALDRVSGSITYTYATPRNRTQPSP
jgi:hypothetical protein